MRRLVMTGCPRVVRLPVAGARRPPPRPASRSRRGRDRSESTGPCGRNWLPVRDGNEAPPAPRPSTPRTCSSLRWSWSRRRCHRQPLGRRGPFRSAVLRPRHAAIGQYALVVASSRSVLYELLHGALIEIRAAAGGLDPMTSEDRDFVFFASNLVHNWPQRLCDAATDEDHDALLRSIWQQRGNADQWLRSRLALLGVDTESLE